ncbi:hypothetical protein LCGC14_2264450 [marine sediment metagenome]|uniref:Uncharacterized protein n=1 Tax=marine sediment metagenome TaxID=412755 RepID=A0A0F9CYR6_9ZZZZ
METKNWTPMIRTHALASKVLVVAQTRIEGTWAAYCDAVPGDNHGIEREAVLARGDKLIEEIARVLFPEFADIPYSH